MEDLKIDLSKSGLSITTLPEKGRCLFTTRDFSQGEVIISQEPYVSVATNSSIESRCEVCFSSGNLKRCSACHVVWYCGNTCQKSDWKLHRIECQALSRLDKERRQSLTPSIRLMVKLCLRRKLQSEKILDITAKDNYMLVEALVSHMSAIEEKQLVMYAQMANLVNLILQWPETHLKEIAVNFSKLACNAHTICDSELRPLGTGLYPVISIINHSCFPNSVLVFEGRVAVVRAAEHLSKGTEVFISYIETAGSTMTRQKNLREQYLFNCTCSRCINMGQYDDIRESAILEGYRCQDVGCTGFLLRDSAGDGQFLCQQCGLVRNKENIKQIASELKIMSNKAIQCTTSSNYQEVTSMYKLIEKLQSELYHPLSINLMRTREAIIKSLMELKDWRGALENCKLTIPMYQRVYPEIHPLLGLQYYTCGKLEWLLGVTDDAVKSLTKAVDILSITHGRNIRFMKELLIMLNEARAEASHQFPSTDETRLHPPFFGWR